MADITVEAVHLTKKYRERTAIEDVSFTARSNDVVGLLGPNGAGKTTTIRILTTVLTPTSGDFRIAGRSPKAPGEIRRRVGVLPESSGYPGFQTGLEHLSYHARLYGLSSSSARDVADSLLTDVGLADPQDRAACRTRARRNRHLEHARVVRGRGGLLSGAHPQSGTAGGFGLDGRCDADRCG